MHLKLLDAVSKHILFVCLIVSILLNSGLIFSEVNYKINNENYIKNSLIEIVEIAYETEKIYNKKIPNTIVNVKREGKVGFAYNNGDEILTPPVNEILEIGTGKAGEFTGKMTGYGADCEGCTGIVSCKVKNGNNFNLKENGVFYDDEEYGKVRVLSAALKEFPCGTIIEVNNPNLNTFMAIVLDTGDAMRNSYENGIIHMDLAFVTEKDSDIFKATSNNTKYSVKRWGW